MQKEETVREDSVRNDACGSAPVIERFIGFYFHPHDEDVFSSAMMAWKDCVLKNYPQVHEIQNWKVNIPENNSVPDFSGMKAEVSFKTQFWAADKEQKGYCIQCDRRGVIFNVVREENNTFSYSELKDFVNKWLPQWKENFKVNKFERIEMGYVNRLTPETVPQFIDTEGRLEIDKVINFFNSPFIAGKQICPPYECQMTLVMEDETPAGRLNLQVVARNAKSVLVDVILTFGTDVSSQIVFEDALSLLDPIHDQLSRAFQGVFTKEALHSFGVQT